MPTNQVLVAELLMKLHEFGIELTRQVRIEIDESDDTDESCGMQATIIDLQDMKVYKFKLYGSWERVRWGPCVARL